MGRIVAIGRGDTDLMMKKWRGPGTVNYLSEACKKGREVFDAMVLEERCSGIALEDTEIKWPNRDFSLKGVEKLIEKSQWASLNNEKVPLLIGWRSGQS